VFEGVQRPDGRRVRDPVHRRDVRRVRLGQDADSAPVRRHGPAARGQGWPGQRRHNDRHREHLPPGAHRPDGDGAGDGPRGGAQAHPRSEGLQLAPPDAPGREGRRDCEEEQSQADDCRLADRPLPGGVHRARDARGPPAEAQHPHARPSPLR